jgi:hypothetical protein
MLKHVDRFIQKFASWSSTPSRAQNTSGRQTILAIGLPIAFTLFILAIAVIPHFIEEARHIDSRAFAENIGQEEWVVTYTDSEDALWREHKLRVMYPHSQFLDQRHGSYYWIGVEVDPQRLERARQARANQFFVGYIAGTWTVFIDGLPVKNGGRNEVRRPVVVQIPERSFDSPTGFKLAVRIKHDERAMYPDTLFYNGLATEEQVELHRRWQDFLSLIMNSMAFGTNLALGLFFLALWLCGVRKQELAAFAAFGLLHAAIQASTMPLIQDYLGEQQAYRFDFVTTIYESVLIVWLGLALARIRSRRVLTSVMAALALPWFIFATTYTPNQIFHAIYFLRMWISPYMYFVAAFLCFAQARLVAGSHRQDLVDPDRILKLHLSWIALVFMGLLEVYGNEIYFDARILNTALLMGLAAAVVHDYRRQELFIRRAPLSKYHQRADLPKRVPCVLATIDLKQSERLYQFGSRRGVGGAYVAEIISIFYRQIVDRGGEVIQTEGDSITFFFDREENEDSISLTVSSIRGLNDGLKNHAHDWLRKESEEFPQDMRLRAAIGIGAIRPTWQRFEGRDVPSWEQTDDSSVFVDVARLLEAESKVASKTESSIIVRREISDEALGKVDIRSALVEIKHERKIEVSIASLG